MSLQRLGKGLGTGNILDVWRQRSEIPATGRFGCIAHQTAWPLRAPLHLLFFRSEYQGGGLTRGASLLLVTQEKLSRHTGGEVKLSGAQRVR